MNNYILYRQRLIPDECIKLKDDVILRHDEDVIVTSWDTLHPKTDLHHGYSAYFLKEGIKVSKFLKEDGTLLFWYCDIVDYHPGIEADSGADNLTIVDLLADVIIYPDGFVKVVDLDELVDASTSNLISIETLHSILLRLNRLLNTIYDGEFSYYQNYIPENAN